MSLRLLPGPVSGSRRSSTIGSDGWLLNIIVLRELVFGWSFYRQGTSGGTSSADEFLDAALHLVWRSRSTDRNGMGEGRKIGEARSRIGEPYWFWMAWSRSKIRLVHKKDGYAILPFRRFCASLLLSIRGFA